MMPRINRHPGENCYTLAVSNILDYKKLEHYLSVWKQCGFIYQSDDINEIGIFIPRYLPLEEEVRLIDQIALTTYRSNETEAFINQLHAILDTGEPVITFVDNFELRYNSGYMSNHSFHCITILAYDEESYTFIDDYYQVKDKIIKEEFYRAIDLSPFLSYSENQRHGLAWIDCQHFSKIIERTSLFEVLQLNNNNLAGNDQGTSFVYASEQADVRSGIQNIEHFIQKYHAYMNEHGNLPSQYLDSFYYSFVSMANNRYLYAEFLQRGVHLADEIDALMNMYKEVAQSWKVAANMLLKSRHLKNDSQSKMLERMINKISTLQQEEQDALTFSSKIISA
ncbi:BtrH N-terminal domain-containing protein [Paenibacillus sp. SYP-B3998]|uniref:BtrH N-terminal domain-containing protein n=1 Tax=Paenibacillus sp. SYP-B3998 TaxID=2678564 RepID=A0A6G3ZTW0_9BACL|nr:BtrH N-terminal domain-containing protein [Paenibacillus sp. SYP-B3998]NEW05643.1 BtrH N-terminal domain-containing protein [Paenibacillus sp. SYP-B3998]